MTKTSLFVEIAAFLTKSTFSLRVEVTYLTGWDRRQRTGARKRTVGSLVSEGRSRHLWNVRSLTIWDCLLDDYCVGVATLVPVFAASFFHKKPAECVGVRLMLFTFFLFLRLVIAYLIFLVFLNNTDNLASFFGFALVAPSRVQIALFLFAVAAYCIGGLHRNAVSE